MISPETIFILGARDPEMDAIQAFLEEWGLPFAYARNLDGSRVDGRTAYGAQATVPEGMLPIFIESSVPGVEPLARIDHHREGDPGYDLPPARSLEASSIGQLFKMLGIEPPHDVVVLAAMDHSFAAAASGEVPGVAPEEVIDLKIAEIAKATGAAADEVRDLVGNYSVLVDKAASLNLGPDDDMLVQDLREFPLDAGYSLSYLTLQVAIVQAGQAALIRARDSAGGPDKIMLTGRVSEELAKTFMRDWAPAQGLVNVYGVPRRGYAAGYLQPN